MSYRTLSEQEAVEYARSIPNLFPQDAQLVSREIGDGNLNFVFRIQDEGPSGKSIIFKQALPYVRVIGDSWPLTLDRARIESEALLLENELYPGSVPEVYHHDNELALIVMEDLSKYQIMRKGLVERKRYPNFAKQIGTFLARTLFLTSDLALSPVEKSGKPLLLQILNCAILQRTLSLRIRSMTIRRTPTTRCCPIWYSKSGMITN